MTKLRLGLCLLVLPCAAALAQAEHPADAALPRKTKEAEALAARVDQLLAARWDAAKAKPAPAADDAEFLRRVYLDLTGTIPPVSEVRAFLADTASDKRRRLIDRLLGGPDYVNHFTNVWRATWLPDEADNLGLTPSFEAWLRVRLAENAPYDRMVREILVSPPAVDPRITNLGETLQAQPTGVSPAAFYLANENKPEKLAGATSRLFLAVRLECAQCHDHPFATWKQEQFWEYAAFFAGLQGGSRASIAIPKIGKVVQARFPDGTEPKFTNGADPRAVLADWATAPDNRYFARAAVNRIWAIFFGVGLAEPVDDLLREGGKNETLDELARQFADHQFDLKFLIRAIVSTRAYQLTSRSTDPSQDDPRLFARMSVKALSTEQVIASLMEATGWQPPPGSRPGEAGPGLLRTELGGSFARQPNKPTEFQTSIPQALALMNGKFVNDATALERSGTLAAVAGAPFLDAPGKVETLYLAALGRKPTAAERAKLVAYVEKGGPTGDSTQALADVFWALLNSSEFIFNH
jgi:hypothetical protein